MPAEPSSHGERNSPDEPRDSPLLLERLHRALAGWNARRLRPEHPTRRWREELEEDLRMQSLEGEWIEAERSLVAARAREVPRSPDAFVRWFEALRCEGPGQSDPVFEWIARDATVEEIRWLLRQELAGEAGFDDVVALLRLRMPGRTRMAPGRDAAVHGGFLGPLGRALGIEGDGAHAVWESLALSNLLLGLAANRRYAWQAVGALGVLELTGPDRVGQLNRGLRRVGLGVPERLSLVDRSPLEARHPAAWNAEVLAQVVDEDAVRAPSLAEGALLRLCAGARCFRRYQSELGVPGSARAAD